MTAFNSVPVRAAVNDVALVAGEEVEVDVAEWAVGAPVRLLDVVPVRVGAEVLPAAVVAGALDVGDGVGRVQVRSELCVHEELLADGAHHADHVVAGLHPRHVLLHEEGHSVGLFKN